MNDEQQVNCTNNKYFFVCGYWEKWTGSNRHQILRSKVYDKVINSAEALGQYILDPTIIPKEYSLSMWTVTEYLPDLKM